MTRISLRCTFTLLVVVVMTISCGGSSSTAPTPPSQPVVVSPAPAGGTNPVAVPLPASPEPMQLWAKSANPSKGGHLVVGQTAAVVLSCQAPGGYRYYIGGKWVLEGQPEPIPGWLMGTGTGKDCDFPIGGLPFGYQVTEGSPNVRALRLYVWIEKADYVGFPTRAPDSAEDITVDWSR